MLKYKYIVKSLTPWMMDELISFSNQVKFDLILLREPSDFYLDSLDILRSNNIKIYVKPFSYKDFGKKVRLIVRFVFSYILNFSPNYNGIIGFKSILWFLRLDLKIFSEKSNIHAQFATQPALLSYLIKCFYSNKPLISFTFHAYDIYFENKWFKLLMNECHKAFSISNYNIKYIKDNYGEFDNIVLSRLGVFREKDVLNQNLDTAVFKLGIMSWFHEKKGIEYLLEAFKNLKENGILNVKLIMAGDGPYRDKYKRYIEENNLIESVEYVGKIKSKEKEYFYKSLDTFILPSVKLKNDQDGIPVVLMEAISYGLPIVSTDISGIPEICRNGFNGLLIQERSTRQIYDSILELMNSMELRNKFSQNSILLSNEYDIEINSKKKLLELNWIQK